MTAISGVGVDAVDVPRFAAALGRRPAIASRLFTDGEQRDGHGDAQRLAARFAAKEATMKALGGGIGSFAWRDVEVVRLESGEPTLRLSATAASLAASRRVAHWHVSLTHTATVAIAMVVAES
ncbi:MAG TPA: holo-ACP synthase [Acidimicrobiales bacterium]|nr:holo-ACP synthase [Acidimicrobiales bacterium]